MKNIILLFSLLIIGFSCKKKPPLVEYEANFIGYAYINGYAVFDYPKTSKIYVLTESSDTLLRFNNQFNGISVDGNKIEGPFPIDNLITCVINGKCKKKWGQYYFEGVFEGYNSSQQKVKGTFEIFEKE